MLAPMLDESQVMPPPVSEAYAAFPDAARRVLLAVREQVFAAAEGDARIGALTETLKWGEPAYLTRATRSGSTLRLGVTRASGAPVIFVNCRTMLVAEVRDRCGGAFRYEGTRGIVLTNAFDRAAVRHVAWLVLTHHLRRRR